MKPTLDRLPVFGICLLTLALFPGSAGATPAACTSAELTKLLEPRSATQPAVALRCNATLKPTDVIAKQVVILGAAASGLVLDCQGATLKNELLILSRQKTGSGTSVWDRPERVTVRNCTIESGVRVSGMAINGEAPLLRDSSRTLGHTERAQSAAPRDILLESLTIRSSGGIPLYVSPGVTRLTLRNSTISGRSGSVAIYLDAESAGNTLAGNILDATLAREAIAIDGSAYNLIRNNVIRTSGSNPGGIYLYRNCGEGGTIRHQTPHSNSIVGNEFFVTRAVWVASRNGNRRYCGADDGYPFGSSASNKDHAQHTVILGNHFLAIESREILKIDDGPTLVQENRILYPRFAADPLPFSRFVTVATEHAPVFMRNDVGAGKRPNSGRSCFDPDARPGQRIIQSGESRPVACRPGERNCATRTLSCKDGELSGLPDAGS